MATKGTMTLQGLDEYLEALANAGEDVDGAARDALLEGATVLQEAMQSLVPILTGRLYLHIAIDGPHTNGNYSWCDVGIIHDIAFTPKDVAIQANTIEYGGVRRAAQPFIRPAMRNNKKIMLVAMQKILEKYGVE